MSDSETSNSDQWNKGISIFLKKICEASQGYRWLHDKEYNYYQNLSDRYVKYEIFLLIMQVIAYGLDYTPLLETWGITFFSNKWFILSIFIFKSIVIILYGILSIKKNSDNIPDKISKHNLISYRFGELCTKIQGQLMLGASKRDSGKEFMENVAGVHNMLIFDSPSIRKSTWDAYTTLTKDTNIYKPVTIGTIEEVEIYTDQEPDKDLENSELYDYEINRWRTSQPSNSD